MAELLDHTRLRLIFQYLHVKDLFTVTLVCERWDWAIWSDEHRLQLLMPVFLSRIRNPFHYQSSYITRAFQMIQQESPHQLHCLEPTDVENLLKTVKTIVDDLHIQQARKCVLAKQLPLMDAPHHHQHECFQLLITTSFVEHQELDAEISVDRYTHVLVTNKGYDVKLVSKVLVDGKPFQGRYGDMGYFGKVYRNGEAIYVGEVSRIGNQGDPKQTCHCDFVKELKHTGAYLGSLSEFNDGRRRPWILL
jgi:AraC-like DNA-binding protein